ncbi:DMT family transporter [Sulfitobacter sp.]|uniref:DMT family transporter n=1 Tax=Sulfitobacter sp. TaxID=1903071 RepID=UPI003001F793
MVDKQAQLLATLIVVLAGAIWGFYWIPVRALSGFGLTGAWGTLAITAAAAMLLSPVAYQRRQQLSQANPVALASLALGGAAFALYSIGFVYGRVAIIILLYFLTPVWSTLIGHYVMGWPISRLRLAAILLGLAGLSVMLGAEGELPLPRGVGEWMALAAGILWSIGTTGMRAKSDLTPGPSAFIFAVGAAITALILAPVFGPLPSGIGDIAKPLGWALATGGLWWSISIASLMWATVRLEPARVGLLLMSEVVVGAASAALIAAERLSPLELVGGALVLCAGVLEIWPAGRRCP